MQKRGTAFLAAVLFCIVIISCILMYVNKPHKSVQNFITSKAVSAESLYNEYARNEGGADSEYLGKIIAVTGSLRTKLVENNNYFLLLQTNNAGNINCSMMMHDTGMLNSLSLNKTIIVKGRCTGYLADVNLVDCVLSK